MVRILISIPIIVLGIFLLPAFGTGIIFLIPGLILFYTGYVSWSGKRSRQIITDSMVEADRIKEESKTKAEAEAKE